MVGVNRYRPESATEVEVRSVDNSAVREAQVAHLREVRARRDPARCRAALERLHAAADSKGTNLVEPAIEAARARASVGEISAALERVFSRHVPAVRAVSGVYASAYRDDEGFAALVRDVARFAEESGRRPRLLVAKLGQDGHDRGARIIATAFADLGFDVDIGALFQTPVEAAREALDNDVHVVGVSTQAGAHLTLVPRLVEALREGGGEDVVVVCGGVIPEQDHAALFAAGVTAIYGPGTNIPAAAGEILTLLRGQRVAA